MVLRSLITLSLLCLVFTACRDHKQEERLTRWEENLRERERQWSLQEADYKSLLLMRDSLLAQRDSAVLQRWPVTVNGQWKSAILCKESNCSNYVIGDQRTEMWDFHADSTGMFANVLDNSKLVRVYTGRFNNNEILLRFKTDSTAQKQVDIQIVLGQIDQNVMKGTQVISGNNNCTAKFSVELTRATQK